MSSDNSYSEPDPSDAMQLVEFRAFLSQHYSSSSFMYVVLGFFFFNLVGFHASGDYTIGSNKSWVENTEILLRLMSFVCPTLIWLLKKDGSVIQAGKIDKNPVLLCIQTAYPIIFSLSLMREAFQELPGPGRDVKYQALFGMMFFPFTVFFLLRDTHRISMLFSLACSIYILANAFYFAPSWDFFACFTTYLLVTAFIFYDWTQQTKRMFMLVKKLQNTLKENEKLAVEAQALELRAMIGNVAHDLKTVCHPPIQNKKTRLCPVCYANYPNPNYIFTTAAHLVVHGHRVYAGRNEHLEALVYCPDATFASRVGQQGCR